MLFCFIQFYLDLPSCTCVYYISRTDSQQPPRKHVCFSAIKYFQCRTKVASFNQHIFDCNALRSLNITVRRVCFFYDEFFPVWPLNISAKQWLQKESLCSKGTGSKTLSVTADVLDCGTIFYYQTPFSWLWKKEYKEKHTTKQQFGPRYARCGITCKLNFSIFVFFCGCWKAHNQIWKQNNQGASVFALFDVLWVSKAQISLMEAIPFEAEWGFHWHHVYILEHSPVITEQPGYNKKPSRRPHSGVLGGGCTEKGSGKKSKRRVGKNKWEGRELEVRAQMKRRKTAATQRGQ